ncbi:hypothetical protein MTR67_007121, partial [Solanum verrucosum]
KNGPESSFLSNLKAKKYLDPVLVYLKKSVSEKTIKVFSRGGDSVLHYQGRLCVPNIDYLSEQILSEAHSSHYFLYSGATKMYRNFWEVYWWNRIKKNIVN